MEVQSCALNCEFGAITVNSASAAPTIVDGMITGGEPTCGCGDTAAGCRGSFPLAANTAAFFMQAMVDLVFASAVLLLDKIMDMFYLNSRGPT